MRLDQRAARAMGFATPEFKANSKYSHGITRKEMRRQLRGIQPQIDTDQTGPGEARITSVTRRCLRQNSFAPLGRRCPQGFCFWEGEAPAEPNYRRRVRRLGDEYTLAKPVASRNSLRFAALTQIDEQSGSPRGELKTTALSKNRRLSVLLRLLPSPRPSPRSTGAWEKCRRPTAV